jgi:ubiquinone/menaquinone biosynthesis C-methylase UbiE
VAFLVQNPERFTCKDGILIDPLAKTANSPADRLMQSPLMARVYENVWRPAIVYSVSRLTYAIEDAIVDRYLQDREELKILDLCCGTARATRRWVDRGARVLAVDGSLAMLSEARHRCDSENLILLRADATAAVAMQDSFDCAICFAAIHLIPNPSRLIEEAAKALHSGAVLFVWGVAAGGFLRSHLSQRIVRWFGVRLMKPQELGGLIGKTGFEVLEQRRFGVIEFVVARRE